MEAVKQNGCALQYASDDLQRDKDFVMAAVKQDQTALLFASPDFHSLEFTSSMKLPPFHDIFMESVNKAGMRGWGTPTPTPAGLG